MLDKLITLMRFFVAPVYTCAAPAERWGLGPDFDTTPQFCRSLAASRGAVARAGEYFWESLRPFCVCYTTGQRDLWHHGEAGNEGRLFWFLEQELFWLTFYTAQAIIPACVQALEKLVEERMPKLDRARVVLAPAQA